MNDIKKQEGSAVSSAGRAGSKGDDGIEGEGLLPCPFCGANDIGFAKVNGVIVMPEPEYIIVVCWNCGAKSGLEESKNGAVESWNKRQKF